MITQKEIARKDFNRVCEINDYEVFTEKQVQGYISHVKGIIQKSEVDNLSEDEVESINTFNEDLPELHKAIVLNDDLSRELVFYRERKVIFEDSIEKSEGIEKAEKIGRYANTHQNRKLGRVGQKFKERSKKAEEEKEKKGKSSSGETTVTESEIKGKTNKEIAQIYREKMEVANKKGEGHKYHLFMAKRDEHEFLAKKEAKGEKTPDNKAEGSFKGGEKVTDSKDGKEYLVTKDSARVSTGTVYPKGDILVDLEDDKGNYRATLPESRLKPKSGVWSEEQEGKVAQNDKEFQAHLKKEGIDRYSKEASDAWKQGGFRDKQKKVFGKDKEDAS